MLFTHYQNKITKGQFSYKIFLKIKMTKNNKQEDNSRYKHYKKELNHKIFCHQYKMKIQHTYCQQNNSHQI